MHNRSPLPTCFRVFFLLFSIIALNTSCNEDDNEATVTLNLQIKANDQDFALGTTYLSPSGQAYKFDMLKFYLSHIELLNEAGVSEELSEVVWYDVENKPNIVAKIPKGNYSKLRFGLGLDAELNNSDPADFDPGLPLSYENNNYWSWASKYIFVKMEGKSAVDTTATPQNVFLYHLGLDELYRTIELTSNIALSEDNESIVLTLDINKIFSTPNTIDLITEDETQSFDNLPLATKLMDNMSQSFSMQ